MAVTSEERHQRIISHGGENIIPPSLVLSFLFFSHVTIPRTSLSSPYLFRSQSECFSPFGSMWDWPQPSSDHLPQRCFLREMPKCFTGCATESQTLTTTLQATVIATWKWLLTVCWSASLTSQADSRTKPTYCNYKLQGSFGYGSGKTPGWLWLACMAMQHKNCNQTVREWLTVCRQPHWQTLFPSRILFCMEKTLRMNWNEFPKAFPFN